jgi:hypothetical protein
VHSLRGTFVLNCSMPGEQRIAATIENILAARSRGELWPNEPDPAEAAIPEGALSLAHEPGDEPEAERGLSRVDG